MVVGNDDDFAAKCCVCGTSLDDDENVLNTTMKMRISKCGHRYCDRCVKLEFQHHREITCSKPGCGKLVKKSQLQDKTKEEQDFNKDVTIRKKILKTFNKTGEDFNSLDEYNAYLEEVEDLIFDLLSEDDAVKEAANAKWKQYKQENALLINANEAKKAEEERRILHVIEEQRRVADERRRLQQQEDNKFQMDIERQKAQLMEVALGERDEKDVEQVHNPSTAIPIDQPLSAEMEAAMMGFQPGFIGGGPQPVPVHGGKKGQGAADSKHLRTLQQRAGGYDPQTSTSRNVNEAWSVGAITMMDDVREDPSNEGKELVVYSPQVTELHLQAEDFGQFDGPALTLWHLRQVLNAPRNLKSSNPTQISPSSFQSLSKNFFHQMVHEEGIQMVDIAIEKGKSNMVEYAPTTITNDTEYRFHVTPQSTIYLSYQKYRAVVCLDASPSTLSIHPITGTLILDVAYQSIEVLLQSLVQQQDNPSNSFNFPEIYLSVIVQGALVDSLCVLVQGVSLSAQNVHDILHLIKQRLQLLEDDWAMHPPTPAFSEPTSLSNSLQNATFALNSLPHDASPMLFLVTDGVVDLPNMYAYDDLMMQLARHNIQCHAIQIGGGYLPHCSFGYVPDTDLLRFLTDATGGALFDLQTLQNLSTTQSHPMFSNGLQPILFLKPSLISPSKQVWRLPQIIDAVPLDTLTFRPLRLFREKIHEYKMRGSVLKITQARLQEGFFISKLQMEPHIHVQCLLQWKADIWLEYSITAQFMSVEMQLRVDVMAQAKFLEEFSFFTKRNNAQVDATTTPYNVSATSVALHTFLKELHERDRILLHLMSAIQMQTLDHETKPILHAFSRNAASVAPAHPVFTLLGDLSPLLWHRWFHVERFELINIEWAKWGHTEPLVVDTLSKWATMQLNPNIFLKFLLADSYTKPNVNRKQRGSLMAMAAAAASGAGQNNSASSAQKKALCFVRLEYTTSAIVIVHVAFYAASTGVRKSVLGELKRLLFVEPSGLVVSHRHIQRLLLEPQTLSWLIAPQQLAQTPPCPPCCCGGSGVSTPVFSASMWHVAWLWHISEPQQQEAIRRLQSNRQDQGLVVLQSSPTFVLLVQEVLVLHEGFHTSKALYQCAISVVSDTTVMTSFWMEPVTGQIVSLSTDQVPFGSPPLDVDIPKTQGMNDTQWFEFMQSQLYQADLHTLSCLLTFYSIAQGTKDGTRLIGPSETHLPVALNGMSVINSPFSAARLLTTCSPLTEQFLLYLDSPEKTTANRHLHNMIIQSLLRLTDCEVDWSEAELPSHIPTGPLWISNADKAINPTKLTLTEGRCFAKLIGEYTMLLAFVPALESLPTIVQQGELREVETPDERLKWLAGLSSSVVSPQTLRSATIDMAWFEQRKQWMEMGNIETDVPFDVLPIQFYECSLVSKPSVEKSIEMESFIRLVKAAHEQNFSHGVYYSLRNGATIQPCDLLQALWNCVQLPLDVDVTRLHAMLPFESETSEQSASLDMELTKLIGAVLVPIPQTQWYYLTGDDSVDGRNLTGSTFFVRFECYQDEETWPAVSDVSRPRSKSVRVISESQHLSNVLRSMAQQRFTSLDTDSTNLNDHVLQLMDRLKDPRYPHIYLRLVVMTLQENQEPKIPPVLNRLRLAIQELCAQQILGNLLCLPTRALENQATGSLIQILFDELPPTSVRRIQYPLTFLPLEAPGVSILQLFHEQLVSNRLLSLVQCDQVYFVVDGPNSPLTYWAYFTVGTENVHLNLHTPSLHKIDELNLLTSLHLGILASIKQVNQFLLLQQLHETRTCSPLLLIPPTQSLNQSSSSGNLLDSTTPSGPFFWPGQFECSCKFKRNFLLKSRLVPHLALNMLCTSALEQFQVHNRHHVFVYRDKRGYVFYIKLFEIENSILELQVFGIRQPGDDITIELCRVLEQKLDETLLRILMKALPNMKTTRIQTTSSRQNKLTQADFDFLVPDLLKPTLSTIYSIPSIDSTLFLHFIKEKLVEATYIRIAPPIDTSDATDSMKSMAESIDDAPNSLAFVLIVNPELSGRSGFVASLGKGLAWVYMDILDSNETLSGDTIAPLQWSKVLSNWPNFSSSLSVRFRVYVRGQLNFDLVNEIFSTSVHQALYEYALESILRRTTQDTPSFYPLDVVKEIRRLMDRASHLSTTSITTMLQRDIIPSYDIEHVVKQLVVPFERLPSHIRPNIFYRPVMDSLYEPYDIETPSLKPKYSFTSSFTFVCPMGVCSKYSFEDDTRLVKTLSSTSLQSADTNLTSSSSPLVSPRHYKDIHDHDTMLHPCVVSIPRHVFYQLEITHKGLQFTSYNCHPHVLDVLNTGFAKALGWCLLRQTLLRSILFQKRGYTLAAPTSCTMLQPSGMVLWPPSSIGKNSPWTPRDFSSTMVSFTPQIFNVLLDNNNPPPIVTATLSRAIEGMGLVEYLRETGTPIEEIISRPRGTSVNTTEKQEQQPTHPPITPVGPSTSRSSTVNAPNPSISGRKAPVLPNATNALMAARARARGVVKAGVTAIQPTTGEESSDAKLPPAWSLTLNKDLLAPRPSRNSNSKVSTQTNTSSSKSTSKLNLPPRRLSNSEKIITSKGKGETVLLSLGVDSVWRSTLRTLLPSSFSHYNRNERNELIKASDPLSYHGIKLRSSLDFHDAYRSSYNLVYDVFKSLMSHEDVGDLSESTLDKLLSCGRLLLHRHFSVSYAGTWPDTIESIESRSHAIDMLTLLSYEIEFIFNEVYATVGQLHANFLCQGLGGTTNEVFQALVEQVTRYQETLHRHRAKYFMEDLIRHLKLAGFSPLTSSVYVKKETEGLVLVEIATHESSGMSVRALFVSERDIVSLDAGRHLPQSSFVHLTGNQVVHTMGYVQTLLHLQPMIYDFLVADMHTYLLRSLSMTIPELKTHLLINDETDLRQCTIGIELLLERHPTPPTGSDHCLLSTLIHIDIGMDISILLRYVACHAKRYFVGDLLVFGTPNAISARSSSGHFLRNMNTDLNCFYSLLLTSISKTTIKAFGIHLNHNYIETNNFLIEIKSFAFELLAIARIDYDRDVLWSRLLCSGIKLTVQSQINLPENWVVEVGPLQLEQCLNLSVRTSFNEIDPRLGLLLQTHVSWIDFAQMLQAMHKETMREYHFENSRHVLLMCVGARDIMIHIQYTSDQIQMEICRREEPPNGMFSIEQRKTLGDFVNHVVYWLWTQI